MKSFIEILIWSAALAMVAISCKTAPKTPDDGGAGACDTAVGKPKANTLMANRVIQRGSVGNVKFTAFGPKGGPQSKGIVYALHGLCDSGWLEASRYDQSAMIKIFAELDQWTIVQPTIAETWYLTVHASDRTAANFATVVMPAIEKTLGIGGPRVLIGVSMGGANAGTLASLYPDLFAAAVLLHPMLFDCDPYRDLVCLPGIAIGGLTGIGFIDKLAGVTANFTAKQWNDENPHALLSKAVTMPKTYVTACQKDKFDLYRGTKSWADIAAKRKLPVTFHTDAKGCEHAVPDVPPVVAFLRAL